MGLGCMNRGTEERSRDCVPRNTAGLAGGARAGRGGNESGEAGRNQTAPCFLRKLGLHSPVRGSHWGILNQGVV